jgi:hypothetical protein
MDKVVSITRTELCGLQLRELATETSDGAVARRLLAIALLLENQSCTEAAELRGDDPAMALRGQFNDLSTAAR